MEKFHMLRFRRPLRACILASALLQTGLADAATYYVAMSGNDGHPGTSSQPWRTVAYAVNKMVAGDTTYVRGGIYNERLIRFGRSGTSSAPIKLLNHPGQSPIIECADGGAILSPPPYHRPSKAYMILIQNFSGLNQAMGWITIEGFEIRNCYNAIKFHNAHNLTIRRNWIHDGWPGSAILGAGGVDVRIEGNTISHNGFLIENIGGHVGGYAIYANGSRFTIVNNLFYDSAGYHIQHNGSSSAVYDPAKYAGPEFAESVDWIVANNVFAYAHNKPAYVVWGARTSRLRIENNIFYENCVTCSMGDANAIAFLGPGSASGMQFRNNLAYASESGGLKWIIGDGVEGAHFTQSGNIVNAGNPRFVNAPEILPASPNFGLTERSPAIDSGLSLAAITTAFDGTPRPQGRAYDIGAYEYRTGRDSQSPMAPVALRAE
jgi:hypothetical protein